MEQNEIMAENGQLSTSTGEIVLYQPDSSIRLEVRMEEETVWLTQAQMADLFQKDRSVITRHINNIFLEKELEKKSNVHFLHFAHSDKPVKYYSLDVIISVGYRVKSLRGTQFRKWANGIIKEYMLRGFAFQQRLKQTEERIDRHLIEHDKKIEQLTDKVDFFVQTALPPKEGIFFDGQIFDAYAFASDLIRSAQKRIILIDNYINDSVLLMLAKRGDGVTAEIVTRHVTATLSLDLERYNRQYPLITIRECERYHDRFLIIDDTVYHLGASLKDLGKRLFAFNRMEMGAEEILTPTSSPPSSPRSRLSRS